MEQGFTLSQIDTTTPHPARMYDALLGGKDNYPPDRDAVRRLLKVAPEARDSARANRAFLQRAVRYLAGEAGIRQIIDVGTGIPAAGNVHQVAGEIAPGTRVAYVDNDPIVRVHANALLSGTGTTRIVLADLREPAAILSDPQIAALIDFTQPVALLLVAIMHFITGQEDPAGIITTFRDTLPAGSFLALSHATADLRPEGAQQAAAVYDQATSTVTLRSHAQITALFDGWDLVDPGLVQVPLWRPDGRMPRPKNSPRPGSTAASPARRHDHGRCLAIADGGQSARAGRFSRTSCRSRPVPVPQPRWQNAASALDAQPGRGSSRGRDGDRCGRWGTRCSGSVRAAGEAVQPGDDGLPLELLDLLTKRPGLRRAAEDRCRELALCNRVTHLKE